MQPRNLEKLDPFYADQRGFVEFVAKRQLHEATTQLNGIVERCGEPVAADVLHSKIFKMLCVDDPSAIDSNPETFFEAKLLPPHDTFTTPQGWAVPSRFLAIDTYHPIAEDADEPNPEQLIRGYFIVFGDGPPQEPSDVLPYYVVSNREITARGEPGEKLHHESSAVFYSPADAWPLHYGNEPVPVHEPRPYEAMVAELELAVSRLADSV